MVISQRAASLGNHCVVLVLVILGLGMVHLVNDNVGVGPPLLGAGPCQVCVTAVTPGPGLTSLLES